LGADGSAVSIGDVLGRYRELLTGVYRLLEAGGRFAVPKNEVVGVVHTTDHVFGL
jgi:hypothetical protein